MASKGWRYSAEYRQRMIDLVRAGRTPEALSRELEASAPTIRHCVMAANRGERRCGDGWTRKPRRAPSPGPCLDQRCGRVGTR